MDVANVVVALQYLHDTSADGATVVVSHYLHNYVADEASVVFVLQ